MRISGRKWKKKTKMLLALTILLRISSCWAAHVDLSCFKLEKMFSMVGPANRPLILSRCGFRSNSLSASSLDWEVLYSTRYKYTNTQHHLCVLLYVSAIYVHCCMWQCHLCVLLYVTVSFMYTAVIPWQMRWVYVETTTNIIMLTHDYIYFMTTSQKALIILWWHNNKCTCWVSLELWARWSL